jgi:hypothetical protein
VQTSAATVIEEDQPTSDKTASSALRTVTGLVLCTCLYMPTAMAHLPELFGREYVRVDPESFQPPKNRDHKRVISPPVAAESEFENDIQALENSAGAYASGLTDPLINLYRAQLERGDTEDAVNSLRRAIQLVRINEGLYSESQLPLLHQLMQLHRDKANYAELGDVYAYYYRLLLVNSRQQGAADLARSLEYLDWERQLYASRTDGSQRSHLLKAYRANDDLLTKLAADEHEAYIALAMSQLRNLYLILGDQPLEEALAGGNSANAHIQRRLSAIQRVAFSQGLQLLEGVIERTEPSSPDLLAEAYLERGDWLYWNGRMSRAERDYEKVYELMAGDEHAKQLAQWFDEPVELPNETRLWPLIHEENGTQPKLVEASFVVNRQGESRQIEVKTDDQEDQRQADKIRAMLRDTHFRPRIGQDGPESGPRVTRYYRLVSIR